MRTAEVSDHALLGSATKRKKGSHPFPFRRPGAGSTWQWPMLLPPTGTTSFAQTTSSLRKNPASCMATTKREGTPMRAPLALRLSPRLTQRLAHGRTGIFLKMLTKLDMKERSEEHTSE